MSGLQEILLILAILLGILFIPRILPGKPAHRDDGPRIRIPARMRIAIAASVIYPFSAAAYFQPWRKDLVLFLYTGIGPVVLGWLLVWVFGGFNGEAEKR